MSEWDFLWDLKGAELEEAMTTGATEADWNYIERCELIDRWYIQLEELKHCKSAGLISKSQYAKGKCCLMESALILDITDGELDGIEIYDLVEQWSELKYKRSSGRITREEFLRQKHELFG